MIRPYQPDDLDGLLAVWAAASRQAHPFLSAEFLAQERENIIKLYLPTAETWVALQGNTLVGFISLLGNEVGAIFVDPAQQGQGVGRALMDLAHTLRGGLVVEVFVANHIGRRFYARYGFEQTTEYIHAPTGQLMLCLSLPESQ